MTDNELREALANLTGYPPDSRTVQAFEHVCREFAAAERLELEAQVARVEALADEWETVPAAEEWDHGYHAGYDESTRDSGKAIRRALDGDR